jgi:dTMP kinase
MNSETLPQAHPGFFITLEGLDGSGKTTQIQRLTTWLETKNLPHLLTRQPGGTEIGDRIRALLLSSKSEGLCPRAELAMMFADRAQAIQQVIEPALAAGQVVLCDRFTDSTEAYQGGGRALGSDLVLQLHQLVCGPIQPDLTILLLPALAASLARARRRNTRLISNTGTDESRFEREQDSFFRRVYDKYREIAVRDAGRIVAIEGDLGIEEVHDKIIQAVSTRLATTELGKASLVTT